MSEQEKDLTKKVKEFVLGKSLNPFNPKARQHTLLAAFLAWVGLGSDGLSSACYGPEAAFLALGSHTYLGIYLAIAISITVFIIALSYNQVIELFPSGGGGYKVATQLIGPRAGLVSGAALVIDYILTITISIASGSDALFSLFPIEYQSYKQTFAVIALIALLLLNLRGVKESIKILMPIFLTFFLTHVFLIIYGLYQHKTGLPTIMPAAAADTISFSKEMGWVVVLALLLRAYSLGGGTYTGIEAVSNNINRLEPPRVKTGRWTMLYMALSLAFVASGIMILYLLEGVKQIPGETLNATAFRSLMEHWSIGDVHLGTGALVLVMFSEASLLFIAANTGYLAGPAVLANMAVDSWVPRQFRYISSRLVTQNGVLMIGVAALFILLSTGGEVRLLLVMYSINVFLTFTLSLLGLCIYWWKNRVEGKIRLSRLAFTVLGLMVTGSILIVTVIEKFEAGGWVTLLMTAVLILVFALIKRHYVRVKRAISRLSHEFEIDIPTSLEPPVILPIDPKQPTAIFFVDEHEGIALHAVNTVLTLFPDRYKNFVFIGVGEVDSQNIVEEHELNDMKNKVYRRLSHLVNYCRIKNLPAVHYLAYDVDVIEGLTCLAEKMNKRYPDSVFFAGIMVFEKINWWYHWLHNRTAELVQDQLNSEGLYMMLLPVRVPI